MKKIRIGSGAGYAGDRIEPAVELMEKGNLDYIIFECLAERTIAIGQKDKLADPTKGYNQLLEARMNKILKLAKENHIKVITNMGSANPLAAMNKTVEIAKNLGVTGLKIAAVTGDDILPQIDQYYDNSVLELDCNLGDIKDSLLSTNVQRFSPDLIQRMLDKICIGIIDKCDIFLFIYDQNAFLHCIQNNFHFLHDTISSVSVIPDIV